MCEIVARPPLPFWTRKIANRQSERPYKAEVEAINLLGQRVQALIDDGGAAAPLTFLDANDVPCVRAAARTTFEFFPVGHESPFSLLWPARTHHYMLRWPTSSWPVTPPCATSDDIRVWLAAASDMRNALMTLAHIEMSLSYEPLGDGLDDPHVDARHHELTVPVHVFVSDIVPETVARSVLFTYILLAQQRGLYVDDKEAFDDADWTLHMGDARERGVADITFAAFIFQANNLAPVHQRRLVSVLDDLIEASGDTLETWSERLPCDIGNVLRLRDEATLSACHRTFVHWRTHRCDRKATPVDAFQRSFSTAGDGKAAYDAKWPEQDRFVESVLRSIAEEAKRHGGKEVHKALHAMCKKRVMQLHYLPRLVDHGCDQSDRLMEDLFAAEQHEFDVTGFIHYPPGLCDDSDVQHYENPTIAVDQPSQRDDMNAFAAFKARGHAELDAMKGYVSSPSGFVNFRRTLMEALGDTWRHLGRLVDAALRSELGHTLTLGVGDMLSVASQHSDASFDRIAVSNVPDYIGLPTTMLAMRRLLRAGPHSCVHVNSLLNAPYFRSLDHYVRVHTRLPRGAEQLPLVYGMRLRYFTGPLLQCREEAELGSVAALNTFQLFRVEAPLPGERSAGDENALRSLIPDYLAALVRYVMAPPARATDANCRQNDAVTAALLVNLVVHWVRDMHVAPHLVAPTLTRILEGATLLTSVPPPMRIFDEWNANVLRRQHAVRCRSLSDELVDLSRRCNLRRILESERAGAVARRRHCRVSLGEQITRSLYELNFLHSFNLVAPSLCVALVSDASVYGRVSVFVKRRRRHTELGRVAMTMAEGGDTRSFIAPREEPTSLQTAIVDGKSVRLVTCVRASLGPSDTCDEKCVLSIDFEACVSKDEADSSRVLVYSVESGQSLIDLKKFGAYPHGMHVEWNDQA